MFSQQGVTLGSGWINVSKFSGKPPQAIPGASQVALVIKNPSSNEGAIRDTGSIPGSGRSPGGGHGNPLQYSCLGNLMDRGAWRALVHWVAKSWSWLKQLSYSWEDWVFFCLKSLLKPFPSLTGFFIHFLIPSNTHWIRCFLASISSQKLERKTSTGLLIWNCISTRSKMFRLDPGKLVTMSLGCCPNSVFPQGYSK